MPIVCTTLVEKRCCFLVPYLYQNTSCPASRFLAAQMIMMAASCLQSGVVAFRLECQAGLPVSHKMLMLFNSLISHRCKNACYVYIQKMVLHTQVLT